MAAAAVLYVNDLDAMRAFYERCFGLSRADAEPGEFCVLTGTDWELTLVTMPEAVRVALVIADPPTRRTETPIKLTFDVAGLEHAASTIAASGGATDPLESVWDFRGHRHLDAMDPEGNVVQLRQPLPTEG